QLRRDQHVDRGTAGLLGGVAEHGGGGRVPQHDAPARRLGDDHRLADGVEEPAEAKVARPHPRGPVPGGMSARPGRWWRGGRRDTFRLVLHLPPLATPGPRAIRAGPPPPCPPYRWTTGAASHGDAPGG